jgi:AcrR family transcriptional regulator
MAQILKEHVRSDILLAAKQEFLLYGIHNASMREIAKTANVTVGNVYRYYKNKEALADAIINPTLELMNQAIFLQMKDNSNKLPTMSKTKRYEFFDQKILQLSDGFLTVFTQHKEECLILLNHQRFYQSLVSWLDQLITSLIQEWVMDSETLTHVDELCSMLSEAIMSGLARGLLDTLSPYHDEPEKLKVIINTYLHLFTLMLEAGEPDEVKELT